MLDALRVTTGFDRLFGAYACNIELLTSISDLLTLVKNDEFNFELVASLNNGITASSQLKIGIGVFPAEISLEQADQQVVSVTGLEKVLQKVEVCEKHPTSSLLLLFYSPWKLSENRVLIRSLQWINQTLPIGDDIEPKIPRSDTDIKRTRSQSVQSSRIETTAHWRNGFCECLLAVDQTNDSSTNSIIESYSEMRHTAVPEHVFILLERRFQLRFNHIRTDCSIRYNLG